LGKSLTVSPFAGGVRPPTRAMMSCASSPRRMVPYTYASAPSSSTTVTSTGSASPASPSSARRNDSGRTPTVTASSPAARAASSVASPRPSLAGPSLAEPPSSGVENRFIAGEPMKPATNTLAGAS
jgi:hypothetical protein